MCGAGNATPEARAARSAHSALLGRQPLRDCNPGTSPWVSFAIFRPDSLHVPSRDGHEAFLASIRPPDGIDPRWHRSWYMPKQTDAAMSRVARLFTNGRSQAVRL